MTQLYNTEEKKGLRRTLRRQNNPFENILWMYLRNRQLLWLKFRRQYSVWKYILDFYCPEKKICIELDWESHDWKEEYDTERTVFLVSVWIIVIRYSNQELKENLEGVVLDIERRISSFQWTLEERKRKKNNLT
jgi:very-short-patch-repair endonuclease